MPRQAGIRQGVRRESATPRPSGAPRTRASGSSTARVSNGFGWSSITLGRRGNPRGPVTHRITGSRGCAPGEAGRLIVGAIDAGARVPAKSMKSGRRSSGRRCPRAPPAHDVVGAGKAQTAGRTRRRARPGYHILDTPRRAILARSLREQRPAGTRTGLPRDGRIVSALPSRCESHDGLW